MLKSFQTLTKCQKSESHCKQGEQHKSSMIGMKPKIVIKIDTVKLNKTYPEKMVLPKDDICINLLSSMETKKDGLQTGSNCKGFR